MATPNVGELITTTIQKRGKKPADNVTQNNAILSHLSERGNVKPADGGDVIREELFFAANTNANSYDGYEEIATGAQQVLDSAEFAWKQYACAIVVSGREKMQNNGRQKIIDIVSSRIDNAEASLKNRISLDLYADGTGNNSKNVTGLAAAVPVDPTTGTYGAINRANFAFWRSQLVDPASTPTATTIQASMNNLWVACIRDTDKPSLGLSDNVLYAMYQASLQPQQRFMDSKTASLGFENIKYMSMPIVLDGGIGGNCPVSTMFFLNTKYLYWRPHTERNFVVIGEGERDPVNQDATIRILGFMGNLTCSGSEFQGRFIGT